MTDTIKKFWANSNWVKVVGIWGTNSEMNIGDECPKSHHMSAFGDDDDGMEINGTCSIGLTWAGDSEDELEAELNEKISYHKDYYGYTYMYIIAGTGYEYGDDEGEMIITDAEVIANVK